MKLVGRVEPPPLERECERRLDFVEVSSGSEGVAGVEKMGSSSVLGLSTLASPWKVLSGSEGVTGVERWVPLRFWGCQLWRHREKKA